MRKASRIIAITMALVLAAAGTALAPLGAQRETAGTAVFPTRAADEGKRVEARNGVVTSANALASEAGVEMLRAGGNAVDAAVATAFAIGVVEPQMSGLGGSGAATVWMKREGKPAYLDFYAAQPRDSWRGHTEPTRSQGRAAAPGPGESQAQATASPVPSGAREPGDLRDVGIPGAVAGLLTLHERFGVLSLEQVMAPAIRLAEDGFPVGQILAGFIASADRRMEPFPGAMRLFFPDGKALAPGETLRNPELAESLRRVARDGRQGFYEGPTAEALVATLNAGRHPATLADLAAYEPRWKRPLCTDYRGFSVLSAPPPQTGFQVLHTLELLEPFDLRTLGLPTRSDAAFDVLVSALRVGQAAMSANADPNWVSVPANGISSAAFAAERQGLVGRGRAVLPVDPGSAAPFDQAPPAGECVRYEPYGKAPSVPGDVGRTTPGRDPRGEGSRDHDGETTHLSVVDNDGDAVSLTITNSEVWGSGGFVGGFLLNNSGFRFTDENIGAPSRSRWRIRTTTIAPTLVLKDGQVRMVIGAPGGSRIPTEIVQVLVYALDYGLDPLDAVSLPRIFPSAANPTVQIEHGFTPEMLRKVRARGYDPVWQSAGYARLYLIARHGDSWIGVADPRHDGEPRGY